MIETGLQFSSLAEFWAMGGYGLYVWLSFGITFVALGLTGLQIIWRRRQLSAEAHRQIARAQRIQQAKQEARS